MQLKRYKARAKIVIRADARIDHCYEIAAAKLRNEHAIKPLGGQGRMRTYAAVNRQQCELLGLNTANRLEQSAETRHRGPRTETRRQGAEALVAQEGETDGDS